MSINKLFLALITGAFLATTAYAADENKPADAPPATTAAPEKGAKPKAKPHHHLAEGGCGMSGAAGWLLSPMIAAPAISLFSASVIRHALRLRRSGAVD